MSITSLPHSPSLSPSEWQELQTLRQAISEAPSSVAPWKMEQFSALFARSLIGKGDLPIN